MIGVGLAGTVVFSAVALIDPRRTAGLAAGHDSERSGVLGFGVIPSCTGESGEGCALSRRAFSWPRYANGGGAVSSVVLTCMPFSASSIDS